MSVIGRCFGRESGEGISCETGCLLNALELKLTGETAFNNMNFRYIVGEPWGFCLSSHEERGMKKLLLLLVVGVAMPLLSAPVQAACKSPKEVLKWPTFRQTASKEVVPDVTAIQYLLRARGFFHRKPSGVFGPQTAAAVRAFERKNGLKADGIVAASTLSRLVVRLKSGDEGDGVRAMQTILKYGFTESETLLMPPVQVNGKFGPQTERALHALQKDCGLKINDVVSLQTWAYLFDPDTNSGAYE